MKTITVNGVEYVKLSDVKYIDLDHVCVIADRGWIFEGQRVSCKDGGSGSGHGINSYGDYFSDGRHCCYGYIGGDGYGFSYGDGKGGHYS